jgi:hypothetical protein
LHGLVDLADKGADRLEERSIGIENVVARLCPAMAAGEPSKMWRMNTLSPDV